MTDRKDLTVDKAYELYKQQVDDEHAKHVWEPEPIKFQEPPPVEPTDLSEEVYAQIKKDILPWQGHEKGNAFVVEAYKVAGLDVPKVLL